MKLMKSEKFTSKIILNYKIPSGSITNLKDFGNYNVSLIRPSFN